MLGWAAFKRNSRQGYFPVDQEISNEGDECSKQRNFHRIHCGQIVISSFRTLFGMSSALALYTLLATVVTQRSASVELRPPRNHTLYFLGIKKNMRCCWKKNILKEALEKSPHVSVTDNPDEQGADWIVALPELLKIRGPTYIIDQVRTSLERRGGVSGASPWRLFLLDWSDRGVAIPGPFTEDHFLALSRLLGRENVHFAQRASVAGRQLIDNSTIDPFMQIDWGHKKTYAGISDYVQGPIIHLDYTVRTDLLEEMYTILKDKSRAIVANSHSLGKIGMYSNTPSIKSDIFSSMDRPKDAAHFWDDVNAQGTNIRLRNEVSRALKSLQAEWPELNVFAGEAGEREKSGRNFVQSDYAAALLEYKIVVVCQRDTHETHYRLMEALISGAMVMTDPANFFPEGIEDGRSIVIYRSVAELKEKILYFLENENERKMIARNGRAIMLDRHRSWQWLEHMLFNG